MKSGIILTASAYVALISIGFAETSVVVPTDPKARYAIIDVKSVDADHIEVISRRDGPSGTSFAKRLVNCNEATFKYLAEGDTMADLASGTPDEAMGELTEGSISTYISMYACQAITKSAAPEPALAATAAEAYIDRLGDSVIEAANNGSVASFRTLLRQNADIPSIALFSLGPYRKNLPEAARAEYYHLVEQSISSVFADHSSKLAGKKLIVSGSRSAPDSVIVASRLELSGGHSVPVLWRVVQRGGDFKIFDVRADGVWLANTQKTSFISVLQRNNGSVEALMAHLRQ